MQYHDKGLRLNHRDFQAPFAVLFSHHETVAWAKNPWTPAVTVSSYPADIEALYRIHPTTSGGRATGWAVLDQGSVVDPGDDDNGEERPKVIL